MIHPGSTLRDYALRPLTILRAYRRRDLLPDLLAGLTVAAVAIPQAIAYASIAELPPEVGLYTAAVAAVVGSLWGSSRHLATGPVNALSLLVLPLLLAVAVPGSPGFLLAAGLLAVMAGTINLGLALVRFGALVTLASRAVLLGFTAGAALHIAVGQLRHLLGLPIPASLAVVQGIAEVSTNVAEAHLPTLALGGVALVVTVGLKAWNRRLPAALVAVAVTALAVVWLALERQGVQVVGAMPRSLPEPTWQSTGLWPSLTMVRTLLVGAFAVTALGLVEAVAAAQALARHSGDRLDTNQELFGQGMANIASGLLSGYPCSGSFTRSALAQQSGARTPMAGVATGVTVLLGVLVLAPYARFIPRAAIAAVLLVVAWSMIDRAAIGRVLKTSRSEATVMVGTFVATLVLPLDLAILSGIGVALAFFVVRSSLPRVHPVVPDATFRHLVHDEERPACPQLGIMTVRGPLFFGAVYHVEEELRLNHERYPGQRYLMLRMHGVDSCDMSGIEMLEATVQTYRQRGGDVFMVRLRQPVLDVMTQSGFLDDTLGADHVLPQEGAIEQLFDQVIDPVICTYECEHRVFAECQTVEKHRYGDEVPPSIHHGHARQVPPELFQDLARNPKALILDLREPEEYRRVHLAGVKLCPLRRLLEHVGELPRDRTLLLCCRSGRRTSRALRVLEDQGFEHLYGLQGGIFAWRSRHLPVVTEDDGPIPLLRDES